VVFVVVSIALRQDGQVDAEREGEPPITTAKLNNLLATSLKSSEGHAGNNSGDAARSSFLAANNPSTGLLRARSPPQQGKGMVAPTKAKGYGTVRHHDRPPF
jgi:hypothetical protein